MLDVSPQIPSAGVPGTALAQPVLQFDDSGELTQRNLVALDPAGAAAVLAQEALASPGQVGALTWMIDDNLGSVRDVVDNSGNPLDHIVYAAFGQIAYESDPAIPHFDGFAGGHADHNTGLVNEYHRWYDPSAGRWLNEDPLGFVAGDANLSRYVGNDALDFIDSTGLIEGLQPPSPLSYQEAMEITMGIMNAQVAAMVAAYGNGKKAPYPGAVQYYHDQLLEQYAAYTTENLLANGAKTKYMQGMFIATVQMQQAASAAAAQALAAYDKYKEDMQQAQATQAIAQADAANNQAKLLAAAAQANADALQQQQQQQQQKPK